MKTVLRNSQYDVTPRLNTLRDAAATFFGELGAWAYDSWVAHNARCFDGALEPGPILWGLTPHGHALGFYSSTHGSITLHTSLVRPSWSGGRSPWAIGHLLGQRFAGDVLLHEMIHQKLHQIDGLPPGDQHNTQPWCDELNRLAALLGLPGHAKPIRQKRVDGKVAWFVEPGCLTRRELATWPHRVRPAGYYEAATADLRARNTE